MQWMILALWCLWMAICVRAGKRSLFRTSMAAGLVLSMGGQLALLGLDGMLTLETALPLHLCGLFGVLSIPLLFSLQGPLWEASAFLAAPCAACTLFFPAVIDCSHPQLMNLAFFQLHVLIALVPVFGYAIGKPLPMNPRRTLLLGSGYLWFVSLFNSFFHTNYLFLRTAPAGTPLAWLQTRGKGFYVCSLLLLCMAVFSLLQKLFVWLNGRRSPLTAGNSSAYSPYSRCTAPCTSRGRG